MRCLLFMTALVATASAGIFQQKRQMVDNPIVDKRQALINISNWDAAYPIPYSFEASSSAKLREVINEGARFWNEMTCLNLQENGAGKDRILVVPRGSCSSAVGRVGGVQQLTMGSGCETFPTASHELAHALGILHEMSRYDRDQFVSMDWANINDDAAKVNFPLAPKSQATDYGVPFEYGSNMQYPEFSFWKSAAGDRPQIIARDRDYQHSLRGHGPSFLDVLLMNRYFKCYDKCSASAHSQCQNGGYMHHRGCNRCICPEGWGGTYCDQKPEGCLVELKAESSPSKYYINHAGSTAVRGSRCIYLITAPAGKRIQVNFDTFYGGWLVDGCKKSGLELKLKADAKPRGVRVCGESLTKDGKKWFMSETNRLPMVAYSYSDPVMAQISFYYTN